MDILDQCRVISNKELINIKGGAVFSASVVNALVRMITSAYELGRTLGTIIRRSKDKKTCSY